MTLVDRLITCHIKVIVRLDCLLVWVVLPHLLLPDWVTLFVGECWAHARAVWNLVTSRGHVIGAHASTPIILPAPLTQLHHY